MDDDGRGPETPASRIVTRDATAGGPWELSGERGHRVQHLRAMDERADRIHIVRLLEPGECSELIACADRIPHWRDAPSQQADGELLFDASVRQNRALQERDAPRLFSPYRKKFEQRFARFLDSAQRDFLIISLLAMHRYDPSDRFRVHVDSLPTFHRERRFSVVCYLNEDFLDGGTAFPSLGITYRPSAGQALLYPSHYRHEGLPTSAGRRYIIVFFLCTPPG